MPIFLIPCQFDSSSQKLSVRSSYSLCLAWKCSALTPKFDQMHVWCISAPLWQWSWYVSVLVNVCASIDCSCVAFLLCSVIRSLPQQIHKASIFAGWRSTAQQFSTERIEQDRKSNTGITLKHLINFKIKHSVLTPDHISLNFINKLSFCAEPGLKSTDQMFSEAAVALNSGIITKSHCLMRLQLSGCTVLWNAAWTQLVGVDGWRSTEQIHSRAVSERTCIQWYPRVSLLARIYIACVNSQM